MTYRGWTRRVTTVRRAPRRATRRKLEARRVTLRLPTARPTRTRLRLGSAADRVAGLLNGEQAEARGVTPPQLLGLWRVQALRRRLTLTCDRLAGVYLGEEPRRQHPPA